MNILYEDSFVAVVVKPQKMPSVADKSGEADVSTLLNEQLGICYSAAINRLDWGVGGLMAFALSKDAAAHLSCQIKRADGSFVKRYLAVCGGIAPKTEDTLVDYLIKNERTNTTKIVNKSNPNGKKSILSYCVKKQISDDSFGSLTLVEVLLKTGRHHQIRAQLSNIGLPLWGDPKYNRSFDKQGGHYKACLDKGLAINPALWCSELEFSHPKSGERLRFSSLPREYPFCVFPSTQSCQMRESK